MDPSRYPQSSSLPSRRLGSPLPDTRNSAYEPRPSLVDYSCSPPFHYPYCGHPLDPLPTLYTAVSYSPVNISPVGDDRHPFAEVRISHHPAYKHTSEENTTGTILACEQQPKSNGDFVGATSGHYPPYRTLSIKGLTKSTLARLSVIRGHADRSVGYRW